MTITEQLAAGRVLVSDGAWGTFLQKQGLEPGACPELWCVERPEAVRAIACRYIEAGSDLIETNSFGANRFKLAHYGLAARAAELNEAAASLSRAAAGDRPVLGSVGPTGKLLAMGDVEPEALYEAFKEQLIALERGGADACCIETFADIEEARLAVRAARENTALAIACTFTFQRTVQGDYRTMMGVAPAAMTAALVEAGADIVGSNCGNGMEQMIEIVSEIRRADRAVPVLVHANAGMPVNVGGVDRYPETPARMAALARAVAAAGANIGGGCCGTTPEHIRAIAAAVSERRTGGGAR
jgi:5-methyltetrahydrofolate--homocysteine methyltransferase